MPAKTPTAESADDKQATSTTTEAAKPATRKVTFRRTLGTRDCQAYGLDVATPPQEGQTCEIPADVADELSKRGLID